MWRNSVQMGAALGPICPGRSPSWAATWQTIVPRLLRVSIPCNASPQKMFEGSILNDMGKVCMLYPRNLLPT